MRSSSVLAFSLVGLVFGALQTAAHANTIGHVYPILEKNLLNVIQEKANSVDIQSRLQHMVQDSLQRQLKNLPDTSYLPERSIKNTRSWVPHITLPATNTSSEKTVPLLQQLLHFPPVLFINANSKPQLKWLQTHLKKYPDATVIATGGNVIHVMQLTHQLIHYDEAGKWVKQFKLTSLPAAITHQGGLALTITEGMDDA